MAYNLFEIQKEIEDTLRTEFAQFSWFRGTIPEDEQVPRQGEEANPFFVLQFGAMYDSPRGKSIKGPRNDDYKSWVQIIGMGSVEDDISAALSLVVDRMIGMKVPGSTALIPDGGPPDYGSRQYSVRPVLYYQTQRFAFGITQNGYS